MKYYKSESCMNFFIEFIGFPGSGKTFYSKKLKKKFLLKKIKLIKNDEFFFDYYSYGIINKLIYKNYYKYKKNIKFESKFIFRKQYKNLNFKINLLIKKFKLKQILSNFKSLIDLTSLNKESKKRSINNFKIDLCSYYLKGKEKSYLYSDEGIIQKVYQPYKKNIKLSIIEKKIKKYLNSIPLPSQVIIIDKTFERSLQNSNKRNKGFIYEKKNILNTKKIFERINLNIQKLLKKKLSTAIIKNQKSFNKYSSDLINKL